MDPEDILKDLKREAAQTREAFQREIGRIRTGRASSSLLESVQVDYYGAKTPLIQLATINAPEARLLVVQAHDPGAIASIEKAIRESDLGLNPASDGKVIRVPVPDLTEERRKELVRHLRKTAEDFRVSIRSHRRDSLEMLKELLKEKEISEDDEHRYREKVDQETREAIDQLDAALKHKEEQVLEV